MSLFALFVWLSVWLFGWLCFSFFPFSSSLLCFFFSFLFFSFFFFLFSSSVLFAFSRVAVRFRLHWINLCACILVPNGVILVHHPPPLISFSVLFETAVVWMKLISFVTVNEVCAHDVALPLFFSLSHAPFLRSFPPLHTPLLTSLLPSLIAPHRTSSHLITPHHVVPCSTTAMRAGAATARAARVQTLHHQSQRSARRPPVMVVVVV